MAPSRLFTFVLTYCIFLAASSFACFLRRRAFILAALLVICMFSDRGQLRYADRGFVTCPSDPDREGVFEF